MNNKMKLKMEANRKVLSILLKTKNQQRAVISGFLGKIKKKNLLLSIKHLDNRYLNLKD